MTPPPTAPQGTPDPGLLRFYAKQNILLSIRRTVDGHLQAEAAQERLNAKPDELD